MKAKAALVVGAAGMAVVVGAGVASANPNAAYIGYGHATSGSGVWCVQNMLDYVASTKAWQIAGPPAPAQISQDGSFGPNTFNMVEWFQAAYNANGGNLSVDGEVGPATGTALLNWASQDYYQNYCTAYVPSY